MKISKASHKTFLFNLFYPVNASGQRVEKKFLLDQLVSASSTLKKLKDDAGNIEDKNGNKIAMEWKDGELEFSEEEGKILKSLVNGIREASPSQYDTISEIKDIINE